MPYKTHADKLANNQRYYALGRALIRQARDRPCVDCGIRLPADVMQFDHVRDEKRCEVTSMVGLSLTAIRTEIAKCDVRCPNCHVMRHWREGTYGVFGHERREAPAPSAQLTLCH